MIIKKPLAINQPEVGQIRSLGKFAFSVNYQIINQSGVFRFAGGCSQKSVAVVGEGESALYYCCVREIVECFGG